MKYQLYNFLNRKLSLKNYLILYINVLEKEKSYDSEIKSKIQIISKISKKGIREYPNRNVNIIIPCATDF